MFEDAQEMQSDDSSKIFSGINFVLCGFDLTTQEKIRRCLVEGGGVDVGRYGPDCTHVIVDKILYDDPICNVARGDRKTLVTGLWVEHSFDVGMPVDPTSIMYRPLRDLNGIPGAKSLIICLTGYQRQDREDIMAMVGLIGATFSKPLVANKITHLVCYKFEGDKYELASKMKRIKLVNHRWLEDSLRAWELLPETDYDKSGYELELMEAQAKDSEDEVENMDKMQLSERGHLATPQSSRLLVRSPAQHFTLNERASINTFDSSIPRGSGSCNFGVSSSVNDVNANSIKLKEVQDKCPELPGPIDSESGRKICNSASKVFSKSPLNESIREDKNSPPPRTPNFQSVSNSRQSQHKACLISERGKTESNSERCLEVDMGEYHIGRAFDPSLLEEGEGEVTLMKEGKTPLIKAGSHPGDEQCSVTPVKRNFADSSGSLKSVKRSKSPGFISKGALVINSSEVSGAESLVGGQPMVGRNDSRNRASLDLFHQYPYNLQSPCISENVQEFNEKVLKTSSPNLKSTNVDDKMPRTADGFCQPEGSFSNAMKPQNGLPARDVPSPKNNGVGVKDSDAKPDLDLLTEVDNSCSKPMRRKLLSKKTLGSRPSFGRGKTSNKKGTIYVKEKESLINYATTSVGDMDMENIEGFGKSHNFAEVTSPSIGETDRNIEIEKVAISGNEAPLEMGQIDDGTESPGNNEKSELDDTVLKGNSGTAVNKFGSVITMELIGNRCPNIKGQMMISGTDDMIMDDETASGKNSALVDHSAEMKTISGEKCSIELEKMHFPPVTKVAGSGKGGPRKASKGKTNIGETERKNRKRVPLAESDELYSEKTRKQNDNKSSNLEDQVMACADEEILIEAEPVASGDNMELKDSTVADNAVEEKKISGDECPSAVTKKKKIPPMRDATSNTAGARNASKQKTSDAKKETKNKNRFQLAKRDKKAGHNDLSESSLQGGKENRPVSTGDQCVNLNKQHLEKQTTNSSKKSVKTVTADHSVVSLPDIPNRRLEPVWFILSGHRLQRKEFQKVIKHLKGRVCRDTHHWSYQATHFIVPDPVRRTEKFFAAAASGRWIVKTDYLTASNEAGKFLPEEPFEWHKNGLSEDGAINLEAPRKWRTLRKRTGHGAFYGMCVIIYGDCIAPPLETLKRVVKSGDGTILATSPPYSRFLESGVDFAIVSPGMPRVDIWVQEFLRHEVPCVLADYLVDFVCKPGYSLDKHVQYNTHTWAEKSFKKLVESMDKIADDWNPEENNSNNTDIACKVCGSHERGEVMLICGDEKGSSGCGIGTHIDCCDPPLDKVPEEDWFCPNCSSSSKSSRKETKKKTRKRTSVSGGT